MTLDFCILPKKSLSSHSCKHFFLLKKCISKNFSFSFYIEPVDSTIYLEEQRLIIGKTLLKCKRWRQTPGYEDYFKAMVIDSVLESN